MKRFKIHPEQVGTRFKIFLIFLLFPIYCSLFTVVLLFTLSYAATVDDIIEHIQKKYNEIQGIQGKFSQTSYIKDLDRTEKYEGRFFISQSSGTKMKWAYTKPRDEEVIINGTDIWVYKRSEKQALKGKFNKDSYSQVPLSLLGSIGNLKANFDITMLKEGSLELKPKRQMGFIKKIFLATNTKDFPIKAFSIFDVYGNKIDIVIKDIEINPNLDEPLFIFKVPAGVEVFEFNP